LQHERREELSKDENSGQSGDQQQPDPKGKGPSADVNMVFMLPMEFLAPSRDDEELDFTDQIAQLAMDPMTASLKSLPTMKGSILKLCLSKEGLMAADDQNTCGRWSCYQYYVICSLSEAWKRRSRFDQD